MQIFRLLSLLGAAATACAQARTAQVFIQPIDPTLPKPQPLAEVAYDPAALASSSIVSYEAPEIPETSSAVRIGLYDVKSSSWISGTTVASAENFSKGYRPSVIITVDARGEVLNAAIKGVAIDAGQTRDFGPQAVVLIETKGQQPELNKPVVLSPEGRKVVPEAEKPLWQKYAYHSPRNMENRKTDMLQVLVGYSGCRRSGRWWRRREIEALYGRIIALRNQYKTSHNSRVISACPREKKRMCLWTAAEHPRALQSIYGMISMIDQPPATGPVVPRGWSISLLCARVPWQ